MLTTEQKRIEEDGRRIVEPMALKLWQTWRNRQRVFDLDDLRQAGLAGLLMAAGAFDPARGVQFSTFAHRAAWGEMVALVGTSSALSGRDTRHGKEWTRVEHLNADVVARQDDTKPPLDVSDHLDLLSPTSRETVTMHLGIGGVALTFQEIAAARQKPIGTITAQYTRALARMRRGKNVA